MFFLFLVTNNDSFSPFFVFFFPPLTSFLISDVDFNIEKKTSSLSKKNLDLDLLDEQSRRILGLIRPDEIMLIEK